MSPRTWKASHNKARPGQTAFCAGDRSESAVSERVVHCYVSETRRLVSVCAVKLHMGRDLRYFTKTSAVPCMNLLNPPCDSSEVPLSLSEAFWRNILITLADAMKTATSVFVYFKWKHLPQCHFHFQRGNMSQWGGDPKTRLALISGWLGKSLKASPGRWHLSPWPLGLVSWKSWKVLLLRLLIFEIPTSYWSLSYSSVSFKWPLLTVALTFAWRWSQTISETDQQSTKLPEANTDPKTVFTELSPYWIMYCIANWVRCVYRVETSITTSAGVLSPTIMGSWNCFGQKVEPLPQSSLTRMILIEQICADLQTWSKRVSTNHSFITVWWLWEHNRRD